MKQRPCLVPHKVSTLCESPKLGSKACYPGCLKAYDDSQANPHSLWDDRVALRSKVGPTGYMATSDFLLELGSHQSSLE